MVHQNNFGASYFHMLRGKFGKIVRFYPLGSENLKITSQIINGGELVIPIAFGSEPSKICDLGNQ